MDARLILFTRYPEAGQVKTRLIPALGADGAARLHRCLTEHCLAKLCGRPPFTEPVVFFTGGDRQKMRAWLSGPLLIRQNGNSLGQRIIHALDTCRRRGDGSLLLIGSDCPDLDRDLLQEALCHLENADLSLGPALDGGFYLLGISRRFPPGRLHRLLKGIPWGGDQVLSLILERASAAAVRTALLKPLRDIDTPEDLHDLPDCPGS